VQRIARRGERELVESRATNSELAGNVHPPARTWEVREAATDPTLVAEALEQSLARCLGPCTSTSYGTRPALPPLAIDLERAE